MALKMPERRPEDGAVSVQFLQPGEGARSVRDTLVLSATTSGVEQSMTVSEHNAWRLFGMMAVMLGIPLPPAVGKAIKF